MKVKRLLCIWLAALLLAACSSGSPSPGASSGAAVTGRTYDSLCNFTSQAPRTYRSIIWIWFGDIDEADVASNTAVTPYTGTLMDRCAIAVNYHNITHPFVPNAIGATSGVVHGQATTTDCAPSACVQAQPSIFDQVEAVGGQWREYVEAPQGTCADTPAADYATLATRCATWEAPLGTPQRGELRDKLVSGTLPAFTFILPDIPHDTGPAADQFLNDWMPAITGSSEYRAGTVAVFITWDQGLTAAQPGETCDDQAHADASAYPGCRVAFIAVGPATGPVRSSEYFTHYSLLRTTEEMLGLRDHLGAAAQAHSMRAALHL